MIIAFYNLNSRINRTIGNDYCFKYFSDGYSILVDHQLSLFHLIRMLIITNRRSPLAAEYFLSLVSFENMIYFEKLRFIGHEILLYLDVIETYYNLRSVTKMVAIISYRLIY